MKNYTIIKIDCYSFQDMMAIYDSKYKADYQLIGYQFNSLDHKGELVMYPRRENKK